MSEHEQETQVKPPYLVIEEHEGAILLTVPSRGIQKELVKAAIYGAESADDKLMWHWLGDFMGACEVVASLFDHNPGMSKIVEGIVEARTHTRARRAQQQGDGL
jgi:hypothetical protein